MIYLKVKIFAFFNNLKEVILEYIATNKLFIMFVLLALLNNMFLRNYTINNIFAVKPFITDLACILLIGAFSYLLKVKNQYKYFRVWLWILAILAIINSLYYAFYQNFVTVGLISTIGQLETVGDSVVDKLELAQLIYIIFPIIFQIFSRKKINSNYLNFVAKTEKSKKVFVATILASSIFFAITLITMTSTDYSRLTKQWNRQYIVERFGLIVYHANDLVQSLTPKFSSLFGYEEAAQEFIDFYDNEKTNNETNEYTNKLEGYNVIFIHMESMQSFLMDLSFNGQEVVPNIKNLTNESMYFNNFYSQVSTGTSSDTEFTLNNSLMPVQSGTVFVSYYNRKYVAIPSILSEKGYYTFSTHANDKSMWNRVKMHPSLGYQDMFFKESYKIDEEVGLGLSDKSFFRQLIPKLEKIEDSHDNYMGTVITLSNHSPFGYNDLFAGLDLSVKKTETKEDGSTEEVVDEYLNDRKMGDYIKSAHYADEALGEFIQAIKNSDHFNKTLFVFYGDHDAKLSKSEFEYLYNYDPNTSTMKEEGDEGYVDYDYYKNELNRKVPLILWTKNNVIKGTYDYPMGMIDILPTVGNMMNFSSPYQLGHDIFNIKDENTVIFPNANFLTKKVYYNDSKEEYISLNEEPISKDYIDEKKEYTSKRLDVSNNIIVYDLIKKDGNNITKKESN